MALHRYLGGVYSVGSTTILSTYPTAGTLPGGEVTTGSKRRPQRCCLWLSLVGEADAKHTVIRADAKSPVVCAAGTHGSYSQVLRSGVRSASLRKGHANWWLFLIVWQNRVITCEEAKTLWQSEEILGLPAPTCPKFSSSIQNMRSSSVGSFSRIHFREL